MVYGTEIYQFLNIRHSKRFEEASPRVRETEVSLQLLSKTLSFSAFVLVLAAGFVALGSLTHRKGSTRSGPSKDTRPIGVVPV
jgi:hypothetical protein